MTGPRPNIEEVIKDFKSEIIQAIESSLISVRYMSLRQAVLYSGFGEKKLKQLAKKKEIKGRQIDGRGSWSFDRVSIDTYWHKPFEDSKATAKEILAKIRGKN